MYVPTVRCTAAHAWYAGKRGIILLTRHFPPLPQVLFGSYPIARVRDPYAVVQYLAEHVRPPLQETLGLAPPAGGEPDSQPAGGMTEPGSSAGRGQRAQQGAGASGASSAAGAAGVAGAGGASSARSAGSGEDATTGGAQWSAHSLCEAFAAKHSWRTSQGGRLDVYRAANWILRNALGGRNGIVLAFLPPDACD